MKFILLDPGHGGIDPGALAGTIEEDDLNYVVTEALAKQLQAKGFIVLFTRRQNDYVGPSDRLRIIRGTKPGAFISIHCNTAADPKVHGAEIYYRDKYDLPLAESIRKGLEKSVIGCRGVWQDVARLNRHLAVLNDLETPAVLVELGYMSNEADLKIIRENPDALAELIASSVAAYFEEMESTQ